MKCHIDKRDGDHDCNFYDYLLQTFAYYYSSVNLNDFHKYLAVAVVYNQPPLRRREKVKAEWWHLY